MNEVRVAEWRKGWPVVLAAALGTGAIVLHVSSLGPLIGPIQQGTGWNRQQIVMGFTLTCIVSIVLQPIVGFFVDRVGARVVATLGLAWYGLSLVYLSYVGPGLTSWISGWVLLSVAFSALQPVWVTGVTSQFNDARGMAIALTMLGGSLAMTTVPYMTALLAEHFGWRGAYRGLACFPLLVALPLAATLFKDARFATDARTVNARAANISATTVRQILLSKNFWLLVITSLLLTAASAGLAIHLVPIMVDKGLTQERAAALTAWIGIGSIGGTVAAGFLLDQFHARLIAAISITVGLVSTLLLAAEFHGVVVLSVVVLLIGLAMGAFTAGIPYLSGKYFGGRNFGFAFAVLGSASAFGGGVGPLIGGVLYDKFHTYSSFEFGAAAALGVAVLLLVALGPYPNAQEGVASDEANLTKAPASELA